MKIENIDVNEALEKAKASLQTEKNIASTTKEAFEVLIELASLLVNRINLNSSNSSKPPSTDTDSNKKKRKKSNKPDTDILDIVDADRSDLELRISSFDKQAQSRETAIKQFSDTRKKSTI